MAELPIIVLAFANEQEGRRHLRELPEESRQLRSVLQEAEDRGLCKLEVRTNATLPEVDEVFRRHGARVAIFHFAGHADADRLLMESASGATAAHAEGLAGYLGGQGGLKLVFLNGCSTRPQVDELLRREIDVVVATARPIDDGAARAFAVDFYRQLVAGRTFRDAFEKARELAKTARGGSPEAFLRDVGARRAEDITDERGFPWDFQPRPGAEETEHRTLIDLAGDPLLGLPPLPKAIRWPPEPFLGLKAFTRREARIFYGRGREIRELYHKARRSGEAGEPDVLLFCGQTGVGKSSVLAAGLVPRLEQSCRVIGPLRRSADRGLLGALRQAFQQVHADEPFDLRAAWVRAEGELEAGRSVVVILDQAEEAYTIPLKRRVSGDDGREREKVDPGAEVAELCRALAAAFDPARPDSERPRGKLILSFRKEWLDEFATACDAARLEDFERVSLFPLDRAGVAEAIRGPARGAKYHLTIKDDDPPLPEFVADDLLDSLADPTANRESPVAPTIQLLLTRMWTSARDRHKEKPVFDRVLYVDLKKKAYELDDVIQEQFDEIKALDSHAVDTGLLVDILAWFTTDLNTAAAHTRADLHARYGGQSPDRLDALLRACQTHYLLVDTTGDDGRLAYRLAHDSLAPLIRRRFRMSSAPGQRARRLLENRAPEWQDGKSGIVLDTADLASVKEGESGMRGWTPDETRLVQASRRANTRRQRARRILRVLAAAAFITICVSGTIAWWGWGIARERTKQALNQAHLAEERLAEMLLRPLGHTDGPIDRFEMAALWEIATLPVESDRVRSLFIRNALSKPDTVEQLGNRLEVALHSAVGLDHERRRKFLQDTVLPSLEGEDAKPYARSIFARVGFLLAQDERESMRVARAALRIPADGADRVSSSGDLEASLLASQLPTEAAEWVATRLVCRITKGVESNEREELVREWTALVPRLSDEHAMRVAAYILSSLSAGLEKQSQLSLIRCLEQLTPRVSSVNAGRIIAELGKLVDRFPGGELLPSVEGLAHELAADPATRLANQLLATVEKSTDWANSANLRTCYVISKLVPRLPGTDAARVSERVLQKLFRNVHSSFSPLPPGDLQTLVSRLSGDAAFKLAEHLLGVLSARDFYANRELLAYYFKSVAPRLSEEAAVCLAARLHALIGTSKSTGRNLEDDCLLCLGSLGPYLPAEEATRVAESLMNRSIIFDRMLGKDLRAGLLSTAPRIKPEAADRIASELLAISRSDPDTFEEAYLSPIVSALLPRLPAESVSQLARQILARDGKPATRARCHYMTAIGPRFPEGLAAECGERLLTAMRKTKNPDLEFALAEPLRFLAPRLSDQATNTFVEDLLIVLGTSKNPGAIEQMALGLASLGQRLAENSAVRAFELILAGWSSVRGSSLPPSLYYVDASYSEAMVVLAPRISESAAETFSDQMAKQIIDCAKYYRSPDELVRILLALRPRLPLSSAQLVRGKLLVALGQAESVAAFERLLPAVDLPTDDGVTVFVEILKYPLSVGACKAKLLKMIEQRTGKNFNETEWKLSELVGSFGINAVDLSNPPTRWTW